MAHSPLQLMSRMASVVKGKYPTTAQLDDVVEPSKENPETSSVPLENSSIQKKSVEESPPNRYVVLWF